MAGSISLSLSQQFNELGKPLAGGLLYFYAAGTTTPQDAFKDSNLTLQHPNPITLDAAGRVPAFYLADGNIKIRLTDAAGVTQIAADNLLVIGPSSGSGSGDTVDATTILATGDIKTRYGTGAVSGFVRLNGRTIGSATSGATERANADTQALFEYLWQNDSALAVSTGRGASSSADWAANKTIALPDGRGRVLAALDDMGNSAAGRLTASYFGASGTTLGAVGGNEKITLVRSDLPNTNVPVTITENPHDHEIKTFLGNPPAGTTKIFSPDGGLNGFKTEQTKTNLTAAFNLNGGVTQTLPVTVPPTLLITNYIKL